MIGAMMGYLLKAILVRPDNSKANFYYLYKVAIQPQNSSAKLSVAREVKIFRLLALATAPQHV